MGGELAQEQEWSHDRSLDWHLLENPAHAGIHALVARPEPRLSRRAGALGARLRPVRASPGSKPNDGASNVLAFVRFSGDGIAERRLRLQLLGRRTPRLPRRPPARRRLARAHEQRRSGYGGSGVGNGALVAEEREWNNQPWSVELTLPPLAVIWLSRRRDRPERPSRAPVPARRDSGRRGNELRAVLRARRAGRALPLRRRRDRDPARARGAHGPRLARATSPASGPGSATATASTARYAPERGPPLQPGEAADRPLCARDRGRDRLGGRPRLRLPAGQRGRRRSPTTRTMPPRSRSASSSIRTSTGRATACSTRRGTRRRSTRFTSRVSPRAIPAFARICAAPTPGSPRMPPSGT